LIFLSRAEVTHTSLYNIDKIHKLSKRKSVRISRSPDINKLLQDDLVKFVDDNDDYEG